MKKLALVIGIFSSAFSFAQTETIQMSAGAVNDVYYKLSDGSKTTVTNTDWDVAFTCQAAQFPSNTLQGATLHINNANGVKVFRSPVLNPNFATLDTTGFRNWAQLTESDTNIWVGAFNWKYEITTGPLLVNYGWAEYGNAPNHALAGLYNYVVQLPNGALKKLDIEGIYKDDTFIVHHSNIDNTADAYKIFQKKIYKDKNFVGLNLATNTLLDREPIRTNWDLQFTRYSTDSLVSSDASENIGVLVNLGVQVFSADSAGSLQACYTDSVFSKYYNALGKSWKNYNATTSQWELTPNRAYFVKNAAGVIYKLAFNAFGGAANGTVSFVKSSCTATTGISNLENSGLQILSVYPNPSSEQLSVLLNSEKEGDYKISVYDISGRLVKNFDSYISVGMRTVSVYTGDLDSGNYLLHFQSEGQTLRSKFIVSK